jgi:hypothetical protein
MLWNEQSVRGPRIPWFGRIRWSTLRFRPEKSGYETRRTRICYSCKEGRADASKRQTRTARVEEKPWISRRPSSERSPLFAWQADPGSFSLTRLRPVLVRAPADDV